MAELGLVKQAVKVPLVEVLALVKEVHEGVSTVNQELALCPVADLEDDLASEAASRASEEVEAALLSLTLTLTLSLTLTLTLSAGGGVAQGNLRAVSAHAGHRTDAGQGQGGHDGQGGPQGGHGTARVNAELVRAT